MRSVTERCCMSAADDPRSWQRLAQTDMEAARVLVSDERAEALASAVCFHAQQAAEKYLKGLLAAYDEEPPRIHSLPELLRRAVAHVSDLDASKLEDAANGLDQFYITGRYPAEVGGTTGTITAEEATQALAWAEEIARAARPYLPADAD